MGMRVDIVTLFPEMCQQVLDASIIGRAAKRGYIETHCHQIRDYTLNKQKQTDDYPYGGGCGMVLYAQPIADCLRAVQREVAEQGRPAPHIVFLTAGGQRYTEEHAKRLAQYDNLTLVCGHYEGIDESYRYIDPRPGWKAARFIAYRLFAMPAAFLYCKLALHARFENRQVLRKAGKTGCFVYGNHTQQVGDPFLPNLALFPKSVYMIVHPNNVSMPVLGKITPYLGALPLPSNIKAMRSFLDAIRTRIEEGSFIVVYPEAHIWPYYTGIRDFPATSMKYPVELDVPSFTLTTTYHRRRFGRKPRTVTYLDGPFYPDHSLPPRARAQALRDEIYKTMVRRSQESDYEYIRYVKKEEKT